MPASAGAAGRSARWHFVNVFGASMARAPFLVGGREARAPAQYVFSIFGLYAWARADARPIETDRIWDRAV